MSGGATQRGRGALALTAAAGPDGPLAAKVKGFYDLYGETGIKQGVPDGNGGWKGGFYTFEDGTADETFVSFFGTNNPYAALQDISSSFRSLTTKPSLKPGKIKSFPLEATLEEVYLGTLKKVEFTRKIMAVDNSITTESVTFTIDLKAGTPDDTRFVFEKSGNTTPATEQGPVIYTLKTVPHPVFERDGADLVYTAKLPLCDALSGTALKIKTLDGRMLSIPVVQVVQSGTKAVVPGEGLPTLEGGKGDLRIVFDITFPKTLSETQKSILKSAFFLPKSLTDRQAGAVKTYMSAFKHDTEGWAKGFGPSALSPVK